MQRQHCERAQPMGATVIARNVGQARVQMGLGKLEGDHATRIINFENVGQGFPAPCAVEVEAVEMDKLGIGR